jgi:hypothetical protein
MRAFCGGCGVTRTKCQCLRAPTPYTPGGVDWGALTAQVDFVREALSSPDVRNKPRGARLAIAWAAEAVYRASIVAKDLREAAQLLHRVGQPSLAEELLTAADALETQKCSP